MKALTERAAALLVLGCALLLPCAAHAGLADRLDDTGLASLTFDGRSLLASDKDGSIRSTTVITSANSFGAFTLPEILLHSALDGQTVQQVYAWGVVKCRYVLDGDTLRLDLHVENHLPTRLSTINLDLVDLTFTHPPQTRILDAGMFGMGGRWQPFGSAPTARAAQMPPVVFLDFQDGMLAFANDGNPIYADSPTISVQARSSSTYGFRVAFAVLNPRASTDASFSLRFGGPGADTRTLAAEVLARYRKAYPVEVNWPDRRPIGALFLATSYRHPEKNLRGWFGSARDIDTTDSRGPAALARAPHEIRRR